MLFTKQFVGGLLVAATLTTGVMTVDALSIIRQPATVSKRAVRVDPPEPGPNSGDVTTVAVGFPKARLPPAVLVASGNASSVSRSISYVPQLPQSSLAVCASWTP